MNPKAIVPLRARTYVRERERSFRRSLLLRRGVWMLKRQPRVWRDLVDGWGYGWSAEVEYLDALAVAARAERGPILECGSGLTTIVLATIAERTGSQIWSLEHDPDWFRVTELELRRFGLEANLRLTPLRDYGPFDWYNVVPDDLPTFSLVICDGPPNSTRGGRYGLLPVLGNRLAPGCTILLDDAGRPDEREVLKHWQSQASISYETRGDKRPFAVVQLPTVTPRRSSRIAARSLVRAGRPDRRPQRPTVNKQAVLLLAALAILFSIFGLLPEALGDYPYNAFGGDTHVHH